MSRCEPPEALSAVRRRHCWHVIAYEAEGFAGRMIGASSRAEAPDVRLGLGVSGWHSVYVGIWNPHHAYDGELRVKVKLSDDPCFTVITDPEPPLRWPGRMELQEAFFTHADLTGRDLVIGQQTRGTPRKAYVAYVRLAPLTAKQIAAIAQDRVRTDTRVLYALNDGNGLFYEGPATREDLWEQVEPYRHSDVGAVLFAAASGDIVNYPSTIGTLWHEGTGDEITTAGHRIVRDSVRGLLDAGIVPMQALLDHCRAMGLAFHAMFRLGIIGDIPPSDLFNPDRGLVRRRPDLRMIDRDGTPLEKASYAKAEVREFMLSLIREVAEGYDIDGINLGFIRGPHFVGFEDVVIEDFRRRHGIDPRTLDENDVRLQRHRAEYLTQFVRSARRLVAEVGRRKGRRIELSAMVYTGEAARNLFFGLDVMTWLEEGLLDAIFMSWPYEPDLLRAVRRSGCRLISHLMPSSRDARADASESVDMAQRGFEAGVDGFWYWDLNFRQTKPEFWAVLRRIGHRDEVERFARELPTMPRTMLRTVGGFDVGHTTNRGSDERDYWPPEMLPLYSGG